MLKPIVQLGHEALRTKCTPITLAQINSDEVQLIITDLKNTLNGESDGVGLSAPQIAVTKRVFIVSHKAFAIDNPDHTDTTDMIFINPRIVKTSKKKEWMEEGCLSIRWVYGEVERYKQITLEYYDEHGQKHSRGFSGFLSHVVQHELDHLDGILFIDHATELRELSAEEIAEIKGGHYAE